MFGVLIAASVVSLAGCRAAGEFIAETFFSTLGNCVYRGLDQYDSSEPASEHYGADGTER